MQEKIQIVDALTRASGPGDKVKTSTQLSGKPRSSSFLDILPKQEPIEKDQEESKRIRHQSPGT